MNKNAMKVKYQEYLDSPEWKRLRAKARERADNKCEMCGRSPDHVHHVRYPKNLKEDVLENLVVVCERCHSLMHGIREDEDRYEIILYTDEEQECLVYDVTDKKTNGAAIVSILGKDGLFRKLLFNAAKDVMEKDMLDEDIEKQIFELCFQRLRTFVLNKAVEIINDIQ